MKSRSRVGSRNGDRFVTVIFYIGMTLVFTFVLWTFAMVFLQATQGWRR
jgi:hypothetical protein